MFMKNKKIILIVFSFLFLLILSIFSVKFGSVNFSLKKVLDILFNNNLVTDEEKILSEILWNIRVPRILTAIMVGCNLALAGVFLQAVMKNPLADPGITGVSSGAGIAVVAIMILRPQNILFMNFIAFIGGAISCTVVFILAWKKGLKPIRMILAGIAINAILRGLTGLMFILFSDEISGPLLWLNGNLNGKIWSHVTTLFPYTTIGIIGSFLLIRDANILQLGDNFSINLGINISKKRLKLSLFACFLTGISVANVGLIGFIGLIVPHIARMLIGSNHTYLIPFSALLGSVVLIIADTITRIIGEQIPTGIVMTVIGVPFFLYLLRKTGD